MTLPAIERTIFQRSIWGRGYRSLPLESKRRSAIIWLRARSTQGWLLDRNAYTVFSRKPLDM